MKWDSYYDGTTTKFLVKRKRKIFLHAYMFIMKRITIDKEDPCVPTNWTSAEFKKFCGNIINRVVREKDLIDQIARQQGANPSGPSP